MQAKKTTTQKPATTANTAKKFVSVPKKKVTAPLPKQDTAKP